MTDNGSQVTPPAAPAERPRNYLNPLGERIFLDRYAWKDGSKATLAVGDTVIVPVDSETRQREIATVESLDRTSGQAGVRLRDGSRRTVSIEHIDKPLETTPEQTMARIARGIAQQEAPEARATWEERFRWLLDDWKFVPGGRIWAGAGTDQNLTFYNCMPPEQEILTEEGYKPIGEVQVGEQVVTHRNRLRRVLHRFERETDETIFHINVKKVGYDTLRLTGEHKVLAIRSDWVNRHRSRDGLRLAQEPAWIPARDLRRGDFLAVAHDGARREAPVLYLSDYLMDFEMAAAPENAVAYVVADRIIGKPQHRSTHQGQLLAGGTRDPVTNRIEVDEEIAYLFGRWLGDGCVTHRSRTDVPSGIKIVFRLEEEAVAERLVQTIESRFGVPASVKRSSTGHWLDLWANSMALGQFFKALFGCYSYGKKIPARLMHLPDPLTLALLQGLFQADGYVSGNKIGMLLANRTLSTQVHQLLLRLGYFFSIYENTHENGSHPAYRLDAPASECGDLFATCFDRDAPEGGREQRSYLEHEGLCWVRISGISQRRYTGPVLDLEVDEDHSFVSAGVVVSNCYVIPSPRDSRQGIVDTLAQMMEIMSRGGGVGINVSSLRPRYSYVKGVNGRSSGSVSWGALYSFVTGLIEQGGCFGPEERIHTDQGLIPARELADRLDGGETIRAQSHVGPRRLSAVFRNGRKTLYEVTTDRGYRVRVSGEHRMATLQGGDIVTVPLRELGVGDPLLLLAGEGTGGALPPLVADVEPPLNRALEESPRFPDELNPEVAYLLGYLHAAGAVSEEAVRLPVADGHPTIRRQLQEILERQFGRLPEVEAGASGGQILAIPGASLADWLRQNHLIAADGGAWLPEALYRAPSVLVGAYVAGAYDALGRDQGPEGGYTLDHTRRGWLAAIHELLLVNGIVADLIPFPSLTVGQSDYRLVVSGEEARGRFSDLVPAERCRTFRSRIAGPEAAAQTGWRGRYYRSASDFSTPRLAFRGDVGEMVAAAPVLVAHDHLLPDPIASIVEVGESEVFDFEVEEVHLLSGGGLYTSNSRRGALMLICNDWHPDVIEFIHSKREAGKITNANISVGVSDAFMEAVKEDREWELVFPDTSHPDYEEHWDGDLEAWRAAGRDVVPYRTVRAREMWEQIIESAWASAEPGLWFRTRANSHSNSHYFSPLICTNPCVTGETLVYTDEGMIPAAELYARGGANQVVVDGRFKQLSTTMAASHVFLTGRKRVCRLQTHEGYSLRATADHRIMTPRGWVELQDLAPGDRIHILNRKGGFGREGSVEQGRTLAGLVNWSQAEIGAEEGGLTLATRVGIPTEVLRGSEAMQRGFLQQVFAAQGELLPEGDGFALYLSGSAHAARYEIQQLLLNFGIASRFLGDALRIERGNLARFATEIGFLTEARQAALESYLDRMSRPSYRERFVATVASVQMEGIEPVYDLTEPTTHSFIANGICVHNCGEQPLPAFGICNLGAVNLSRFVVEGEVDWPTLGKTVRYAVRFLDDVIDATPYFFEENAKQQLKERRVGLGVMGLAEMMIRLGLRYGSAEGNAFVDRLFEYFATQAYLASTEYAEEKGAFPAFDADLFLQSGYMQSMPEAVREQVRQKGIRNVTLLTVAPTGCVAPDTLVSTASGLRPIVSLGDPEGSQWQILTDQVHTDEGLRPTSHFYVNGHREVKRVRTARGFALTATHNHRVRVVDGDGRYLWRRMDELRPGDRMVLKKGTMGAGEPVPLKQVSHGVNSLSASSPAAMSPALAELLGYYMGDGYLKKSGGIHLVVTQQDPDLLDHLSRRLQELWGPRQTPVEARVGCWTLTLHGRYIPRYFEANGFAKPTGNEGEGAEGAFIPEAVLRAGRDAVAAFLRGLFEADGRISRGTITLVSTSRTLVDQTQVALLALGMVSTVREMPDSENRFGTRQRYELRLLNRREATMFVERVGFLSDRKRAVAADLGAMSDRGDNAGAAPLLDEFYATSQGLPNDVRQVIIQRTSNGALTQQFVKEMVADHPALMDSRLARLVDMDIFLDEVATIEDGTCDTYDLSVPDNHTYIANGFVSHNTTGTMVGTSTGIEPYYFWSYYRKSRLGMHEEVVDVVAEYKEANQVETLPEFFVTAMDLSPEDHVKVQAAVQRWVDSSISKTCNVPNDYTVEQTAELYELMYELGCKGGTVYRDGSRSEQVLTVKADEPEVEITDEPTQQAFDLPEVSPNYTSRGQHKRARPQRLHGATYGIDTPVGRAYVTVNRNGGGQPFEVFANVGKVGSEGAAMSEAIGRLISLALRLPSHISASERLEMVVKQLEGIGGGRSIGFGPSRINSLPDALARVLRDDLEAFHQEEARILLGETPPVAESPPMPAPVAGVNADLCPECGHAAFVRIEGCRKCHACGHSEC